MDGIYKVIRNVLAIILLTLQIIKHMPKKNFWKTAFAILRFLVEEWEILYPLIKDLVDEIKEQNEQNVSV